MSRSLSELLLSPDYEDVLNNVMMAAESVMSRDREVTAEVRRRAADLVVGSTDDVYVLPSAEEVDESAITQDLISAISELSETEMSELLSGVLTPQTENGMIRAAEKIRRRLIRKKAYGEVKRKLQY